MILPWLTKAAHGPRDPNYTGVVFGRYFLSGKEVDEGTYKAYAEAQKSGTQPKERVKKTPPPLPKNQSGNSAKQPNQSGKKSPPPLPNQPNKKPQLDDLLNGPKEKPQGDKPKPKGDDPFADYVPERNYDGKQPPPLPKRPDTIPRPASRPDRRGQLMKTLDFDGKKQTFRFSSQQQKQAVEAVHQINEPRGHSMAQREASMRTGKRRLQAFADRHFNGDLKKARAYANAEYKHVKGQVKSDGSLATVGRLPAKYGKLPPLLPKEQQAVDAAMGKKPATPPELPKQNRLTAGSQEDLKNIPKVGADFWDDAGDGKATPPPLPEHHATQKSALDAANNVLNVAKTGDRDAMTRAHKEAFDAINSHHQAGMKAIDKMAIDKHGYTAKAKQVAHRSKQKFTEKIQAARDKIQKAAFANAPPAMPSKKPPLPNETMPFDWSGGPSDAVQPQAITTAEQGTPRVDDPSKVASQGEPQIATQDEFQRQLDETPNGMGANTTVEAPKQPVAAKNSTSTPAKQDLRPNDDIDAMFAESSTPAKQQPQGDLRRNDALDDVFGEPVDEAKVRAQQPYQMPTLDSMLNGPKENAGKAASTPAPSATTPTTTPHTDPSHPLHIDNSHQHAPVRPSQHTHPDLAGMKTFQDAHPDDWDHLRDIHANHLSSSSKTLERAINRQNREIERASEPGGHPDDIRREKSVGGLLYDMHAKAEGREKAAKESKEAERQKRLADSKAAREAARQSKKTPQRTLEEASGEKPVDPEEAQRQADEEKRRDAARKRIERFRESQPKRIAKNKLRYVVREMGGIDPENYEKNFGSVQEDLREGGLQSIIRRSKMTNAAGAMSGEGRGLDEIAEKLIASGHLGPVPDNMHASEYLVQQLIADADHNHAVDEHRDEYESHQAMLEEKEKREFLEQSSKEDLAKAAELMANHGYLNIPDGVDAGEYLKGLMEKGSTHSQSEIDSEHDNANTQYEQELEEARNNGHSEREINETIRSSEKAGLLEAQKELEQQSAGSATASQGAKRFIDPADDLDEVDESEQFDRRDEGVAGDFEFGANDPEYQREQQRNADNEEALGITARRRRDQADFDATQDENPLEDKRRREDELRQQQQVHTRWKKSWGFAELLTVELDEPIGILPWLTKGVNERGDGVSFGKYFLNHEEVSAEQYHAAMDQGGKATQANNQQDTPPQDGRVDPQSTSREPRRMSPTVTQAFNNAEHQNWWLGLSASDREKVSQFVNNPNVIRELNRRDESQLAQFVKDLRGANMARRLRLSTATPFTALVPHHPSPLPTLTPAESSSQSDWAKILRVRKPKLRKFSKADAMTQASRAKVELDDDVDKATADEVVKKLFPRATTRDSYRALSRSLGMPDDAKVRITGVGDYEDVSRFADDKPTGAKGMVIEVEHPAFAGTAERFIGVDKNGRRFIKNEYLVLKQEHQDSGLGRDIFTRQVEWASRSGMDYIQTHAAGDGASQKRFRQKMMDKFGTDDVKQIAKTDEGKQWLKMAQKPMNGYYTWPRFGYDMSLRSREGTAGDEAYARARKAFPEAKTILDLFETEEGRQWWKENGTDLMKAKFDLSPKSRSMAVLRKYNAEKKAKNTT
ncbi:MAG: hypothetical protein E6R03_11080, partial [Hyphomicrobiaceae bacterium]